VNNDWIGNKKVLKNHDHNVAQLPSVEEILELLRELNELKQTFKNKTINKHKVSNNYFSFVVHVKNIVVLCSMVMICQVWSHFFRQYAQIWQFPQ
jgi:hypothetical protein